MSIVGIIAEYNPFHSGHAYQIRKAKELTGADYAVVIMSPDFVQRGEPAILDKYVRTCAALEHGADLVLELPVCYAAGSAEYFAGGSMTMLDKLGCIDFLCFGCETPDASLFLKLADFLEREPAVYRSLLREYQKQGMTFPAAREKALILAYTQEHRTQNPADVKEQELLFLQLRAILHEPNNILGLEYCRALIRLKSRIRPVPMERTGQGYHSGLIEGRYISASAVRKALCQAAPPETLSDYVPGSILEYILRNGSSCLTSWNDFSSILHYQLLVQDQFSDYLDISSDLNDRILNIRNTFTDPESFISRLKTRSFTESRIRRCLLHILLQIRRTDVQNWMDQGCIFYARILGFRKDSARLLHALKQSSRIPLLSKPSNAANQIRSANPETDAVSMFECDLRSSGIYRVARTAKTGKQEIHELQRSPVISS